MASASEHADTDVLIVGGGLVGLSAALFLQRRGVPFVLVEKMDGASPLPRARGLAVRTMELFRSVGLQQAVEDAAKSAWEMGVFGGGRMGRSMLESEALAIPEGGKHLKGDDPSPCDMTACPQTIVEPVLRHHATARGGDLRFGHELVGLAQDDARVTATVRGPDGEATITAAYLLAADGARGFVRHQLGIPREGDDPNRHYLNVFFEADLAERTKDRTFSQCEIRNEQVEGFFLSMNNTTKWSFHLLFDPEKLDPMQLSEDELADLLRAAIGADVPVTIRHRSPWTTGVRIAARYREARVFLAGDTAHSMPPWGGLGANTGIADAHDLAAKLAAVLNDGADPATLDAYEAERRPVAVRNGAQSLLRTDFKARLGIRTDENAQAFDQMVDGGACLMRYDYADGGTVEKLHAQPGTRFPHAWIVQDGARRSTLDLFGGGPVTLAGPDADAADGALRAGHDFMLADGQPSWGELTGGADGDSVTVRADGFVEARQDA